MKKEQILQGRILILDEKTLNLDNTFVLSQISNVRQILDSFVVSDEGADFDKLLFQFSNSNFREE